MLYPCISLIHHILLSAKIVNNELWQIIKSANVILIHTTIIKIHEFHQITANVLRFSTEVFTSFVVK